MAKNISDTDFTDDFTEKTFNHKGHKVHKGI